MTNVTVTPHKKVTSERSRPSAKGLGITTEKPKFPGYAQVAKRLETFQELGWPSHCPVSVQDLVDAGLVYTGVGDSVRCYYCGGGLRNWDTGDDPMVEHARWYPNCPHVLLVMGKQYVQNVADGLDPNQQLEIKPGSESHYLKSVAAQALIENGYSTADVLKSILIFQNRYGDHTHFSGQDLCTIIIEIEENPELAPNILDVEIDNIRSLQDDDNKSDCSDTIELLADLCAENDRLKQIQTCKVCIDKQADVVFLPCGHICCCPQCAPAMNKCPICRKTVNGFVKAFFATNADTACYN